jgi:glycosyltransferase involved in cell wall biosynthesis
MSRWAILTGEYPPQPGGVSDYTRLVAEGLAASGDEVIVYAPRLDARSDPIGIGVRVSRLPDRFGLRGLRWLDRDLTRERPDRILVQYVPHAFGLRAMNLPFTAWLAVRAQHLAPIWVMFHEVSSPFVRWPIQHMPLAIVTRMMARMVAGSAERVLVSIPHWNELLGELCPQAQDGEWMPVPCTVATTVLPEAVAAVRSDYAADPLASLVGHFGTFGRLITGLLEPSIVGLLRSWPPARVLLIGRGSEQYLLDLLGAYPELNGRVSSTGELSPAAVAAHLQACDLLLQPYADGVSCRRTSVMAGLANRVPIVTNLGPLSEPIWKISMGATVIPGPDPAALAAASVEILRLTHEGRLALGAQGAELYGRDFSVERTISRLRHEGHTACSSPAVCGCDASDRPHALPA